MLTSSCGGPRRRDPAFEGLPPGAEEAYLRGDWATAIRALEPLMQVSEDRVNAAHLEILGRCRLGAQNWPEALEAFRRANRASRDAVTTARTHEGMARAYFGLDDWSRAVGELDRMYSGPTHAVDRAVPGDETRLLFATACARAGRWDDAIAAYEHLQALATGEPARIAAARLPVARTRSFRVQFGSFEDPGSASNLQERLDASLIPTEILTVGSGPQARHVVLSPRADSWSEAERLQAQYRAAGLDALAVP